MRIAFAGGGTGGHVFPIRALIQHIETHAEYKNKAEALVWFGEHGSLEEQTAKEFSQVEFVPIHSGKLRRSASFREIIRNIADLGSVAIGIVQCIRELKKHKIDAIFCKGGYVSLPVVIAGRMLHKTIILHESDTQAGLSNKICARFAGTIFTGFAGVFPGKEIVVGQILSSDLLINSKLSEDLNPHPTVSVGSSFTKEPSCATQTLVTGGSQGAESVYKPLAELIKKNTYVKSHFHVILGMKNMGLRRLFEGLSNVTCYDFVSQQEMGELLHLCDAAITRAGTTSLAEEKLFGLKLVMIPIPRTHDQLKNAEYYAKNYADTLVKQDESFLLSLPAAVESIQGYKKKWSDKEIENSIDKPKDLICRSIFTTK